MSGGLMDTCIHVHAYSEGRLKWASRYLELYDSTKRIRLPKTN